MSKALVLSGGGPVGVAWQAGLAVGLAHSGVRLGEADLIVGTSAGSIVGAHLGLGKEMGALQEQLEHFWAGQARPAAETGAADDASDTDASDAGASAAIAERMQTLLKLMADATTPEEGIPAETRAALGRFALEADAGPEERFAGAFAFMAGDPWPARFRCTAVDAENGAFVVWDGRSGEGLDRAVRYFDGEQPIELPGLSCFLRDDDRVFHTYSAYGRGTDNIGFEVSVLDLTALGRQDD